MNSFGDDAYEWLLAKQSADDALMASLRIGIAPPTAEELQAAVADLREDPFDDDDDLDDDERQDRDEAREHDQLMARMRAEDESANE